MTATGQPDGDAHRGDEDAGDDSDHQVLCRAEVGDDDGEQTPCHGQRVPDIAGLRRIRVARLRKTASVSQSL